jgi:plasmid maintenance system killer protein
MFGKTGEAKLQALLTTTLATKDPGKVAELVNIVTSIGGENGGKIGMQIMTEISAPGQEDKFDDRLSALAMLQKLDNKEINLGLFLEGNAIGKLDELIPMLNKIEAIKGPITLKVLQDFQTTNPDIELGALITDWEKYSKLPDELKKTAIQTYVSIYKSITPETQKEMAKEAVVSSKLGYLPGVSEALRKKFETNKGALAAALNDPIYADGVDGFKKGNDKSLGDGDKKGSRDTTLDDLLKKLKLTRDASINAEGGLKSLRSVFNKANGDITKFAGLNELLRKQDADEGFIDFLGGMDNATEKGYVNVDKLKQGILELSGDGIKAMALYKEAQLGAFGDTTANSIYQLQKQRTGFVALKSAGASSSDALEMVSDANFAISLSAAKTAKEVQGLIDKFKALKRETDITLAQTDPQQYFDNQMSIANRRYDLDEALARRNYEPQIEALELTIDATNRLIDAEQNRIKLDYDAPIESKQKEISVLQNQLSMGVQKQLDANSKISAALSEDQAVIGNIVDQINNKYDLQEKALTKISNINQDIIEQQKDQINLADALTSGNISAAAQAAEEMKQRSAAAVASKAQEMLDQRRQADIAAVVGPSGLTADQISKRQYQIDRSNYSLQLQREAVETKIQVIEEAIYNLQVLRGNALEGIARDEQKIYDINVNQIQPLRDKLKAELDTIDAQRDKWRDANLAIEKANLNTTAFKDELIKAEGLVDSLAKLWGNISSKEVTLTIKKIEELIGNQGSGAGSGGTGGGGGPGGGGETGGGDSAAFAASKQAAADYATAKAAGDMKAAALAAAKVIPSALAAGESGAIGAASIAAQLKAAEKAQVAAANAAALEKQKLQNAVKAESLAKRYGYLSAGGMVPKYFAAGGLSRGTDIVPAMLTPGEFVINKNAASEIGINNLNRLNNGESVGGSVYNYSVGINVTNADANANDIARAVMGQIKYIDSQRIRGQK